MKKLRILAFNKCYLPGYRAGGPIRTLSNMVNHLSCDFVFFIVTLDRDTGDVAPYNNIIQDAWNNQGKAKVMYLSEAYLSRRQIVSIVSHVKPDVIYLNSFFDYRFTQRVLWARWFGQLGHTPIIIAPRGEFSEGALQLKRLRKKVFLQVTALLGLYRGLKWQASSINERDDILQSLHYVHEGDIHIGMDLASIDAEMEVDVHVFRPGDVLRVCFLSRIVPMKNLDFALRVLSQVKSEVLFTIYGPKENTVYWSLCEKLIAALPANVNVDYMGEVHPNEVRQCLARHDLFFLPTRGENYGHVIIEALSSGLPVLISDQTPWGEIDANGVGWNIPLDMEDSFSRKIDELARWDEKKFAAVKRRAAEYAMEHISRNDIIQSNREMFLSVI